MAVGVLGGHHNFLVFSYFLLLFHCWYSNFLLLWHWYWLDTLIWLCYQWHIQLFFPSWSKSGCKDSCSKFFAAIFYGPGIIEQHLSAKMTPGEISNVLKSMKMVPVGYVEINACPLKHISPFITEPLKYSSNRPLREGVLPTEINSLYNSDDVLIFDHRPFPWHL